MSIKLRKTNVEIQADSLLASPTRAYQTIINLYNNGITQFWDNRDAESTPVKLAEEAGTNMLELFTFHGQLKQFILTMEPDAANDLLDYTDFGTFQPVLDADNNPTGAIEILTYKRNGQWLNGDGTPVA